MIKAVFNGELIAFIVVRVGCCLAGARDFGQHATERVERCGALPGQMVIRVVKSCGFAISRASNVNLNRFAPSPPLERRRAVSGLIFHTVPSGRTKLER